MKKLHVMPLLLLVFATAILQCVRSEVIFIVSESDNPCPTSGSAKHGARVDNFWKEPCLTFAQFLVQFNNHSYQNLTNITLELESGEHKSQYFSVGFQYHVIRDYIRSSNYHLF